MPGCARQLGRSPTTISHELVRNRSASTSRRSYAPYAVQKRAAEQGLRPKASKFDNVELASVVQSKLCLKWSPEQISDHLAVTFADRQEMRT